MSEAPDKVFTFGIRDTPCGAVAWMETPSGRKAEKRFRNGYASARISAERWIAEQIATIRDMQANEGLTPFGIVETHK